MVPFINWQVEKKAKMRDWQNQTHVKYYCKYHIVFVPKYLSRKSIYGTSRKDTRRDIERALSAALCRASGRACDARTYSYITNDIAKI